MKAALITLLLLFSIHSNALEWHCESTNPETPQMGFVIEFAGHWAKFKEDHFLGPKYGFTYDPNEPWRLEHIESYSLLLENTWHYTSQVLLTLSTPFLSLLPGDTLEVILQGNDGDGVQIEDEAFTCQVFRSSI